MADKIQIINHPDFIEQQPYYLLYEDLSEGGARIENQEKYLPQHAYESNPQYAIRRKLATYKNHARPIVTVFTSSIWRKPPTRELPKELDKYESDVDRLGSSAGAFFRETSDNAAAIGLCFVAVDSTRAPDGEKVTTLADSQKFGIRPYMIRIPAANVPAWGFDDDGLAYVVINEAESKDIGPFTEQKKIQKYRIWYRDRWELWQENDKKDLSKIGGELHPCGEVPVRPLYFRKKKELIGESCIKDVASLLLRAYMLENALDKSLFDTAFPQQYFMGFDEEQVTGYIKASSNGLSNPDSQASTGFVEPNGQSYEALDSKVRRDEVSIREIALRMIRPDSKMAESAESKKIDRQQLDSQLSVFSQACEDLEKWAWNMMLKWLNAEAKADKVSVEYNKDFDVTAITGDLLRAFGEMRRNGDISKETYWQILQNAEVPFPEDFDEVEEMAKIDRGINTSSFGSIGATTLIGT